MLGIGEPTMRRVSSKVVVFVSSTGNSKSDRAPPSGVLVLACSLSKVFHLRPGSVRCSFRRHGGCLRDEFSKFNNMCGCWHSVDDGIA